jgi:hypothetical protein
VSVTFDKVAPVESGRREEYRIARRYLLGVSSQRCSLGISAEWGVKGFVELTGEMIKQVFMG